MVLAAGLGTRFGDTKQLAQFHGSPLVQHVVDAAGGSGVDEIIVVVGHDAQRVRSALTLPESGRIVENPDYSEGQASSLHTGLRHADPTSQGALILLADQPGVDPAHLRAVAERFRTDPLRVVRLRYRDGPGPAVLPRGLWDEVLLITGDVGARQLFERHAERVDEVVVDADVPPDVDTPDDLGRLGRTR
ncbi:MAG: nucleotidyltransferase family protein [Actinomycetota bacterium]